MKIISLNGGSDLDSVFRDAAFEGIGDETRVRQGDQFISLERDGSASKGILVSAKKLDLFLFTHIFEIEDR